MMSITIKFIIISFFIFALLICAMGWIYAKADNKSQKDKIIKLTQDLEDKNNTREKVPVLFGHSTYMVYKDSTIEEIKNAIPYNPTFVKYNWFGEDVLDYYYRRGLFDLNPVHGEIIHFHFKEGRLVHIENI